MNPQTIDRIAQLLQGDLLLKSRVEIESVYPARSLPPGAEVMRVPPSPTGFVHIGTIYAGLVNERIAHQSGGVFILRIEDTDKKREVQGSVEAIIAAFDSFSLKIDEGPVHGGTYGPYSQSERASLYMTFALELLRGGRAYPCFATTEELQENVKKQQAAKVRPGYYGDWALWRDRDDADISSALDAGKPFVLRFKSLGTHNNRITYTDVFKGEMNVPQNDMDVPLIKADGTQLPTYHLAHVVDDYLMRVTKVFRSDEWLPSTALHMELCQSLAIAPFTYGHFAPISILDKNGGGKRKLSKRKDPEADVQFWLQAGYPVEGVRAYLLGLANSSFEDWYRANPTVPINDYPVSLHKLAASRAPLLDMAKLEDYCKDILARLPQADFERQLLDYMHAQQQKVFLAAVSVDQEYASRVFAIERSGDKPRKDLAKWCDAVDMYGYFFDDIFATDYKKQGRLEYLSDFTDEQIAVVCKTFMQTYDAKSDQPDWFDKLKSAADNCDFAVNNADFKKDPQSYVGNVADFARIIRVTLTGKNRTPDLWMIMQVMGEQRVGARLLS